MGDVLTLLVLALPLLGFWFLLVRPAQRRNREVAQLFRKLADIETLHAKRILEEMKWASVPALPPAYAWEGDEGPETAPFLNSVTAVNSATIYTDISTARRIT